MLNRLPIDAIVAITNELEGRDIARLWICGDALLNHRLGRGGGVKKFSQTFDSLFPGTWPSIVIHLVGLEEFTVEHSWNEMPDGEWKPCYSDLSKTVVRVRLAHPDDIISFHEALLGGGTPNLLELTNIGPKESQSLSEEVLASIMARLPHLQVLVFGWAHAFPLPPRIWPKQLRKLRANLNSLGEGPVVLPESLEELELNLEKSPSSLLSIQWPPNLILLDVEAYCNAISLEELRRLPRSLTDLMLMNARFENSPEYWKALPPNLTYLNVELAEDEEPMLELLPRTLKQFNAIQAELNTVKLLPPSLTKISDMAMPHDPKMYELLPTGLRYADMGGGVEAQDGGDLTWTRLPDSIEDFEGLDVRYLDHYPLPRCIRSLRMADADLTDQRLDRLVSSKMLELFLHGCKFDSQALIRCLPPGLTTLRVHDCYDFAIDGELCKLFPKKLRTLEAIPVKLIDPKALSYLPASLEILHVHSNSCEVGCLGDSTCSLPKLNDLFIRVNNISPGLAPYLFAVLPRKLKGFSLSSLKSQQNPLDITDASLESLPPGLLTFSTSAPAPQVSGSWIARKPRCLRSAWLGSKVNLTPPTSK